MIILADLASSYFHDRSNYDEITPLDKSIYHDGEETFVGFDVGFYVADKYKAAKSKFIYSCPDTKVDLFNLGGMVNGHMGGTYYFLSNNCNFNNN